MEYLLQSRVFFPHLDHERIHDYTKPVDESVRPNHSNHLKRRNIMKKLKALLLFAVVAIGIVAISTGARQLACCSDADCFADCSGC
jgi:hypothetical protein